MKLSFIPVLLLALAACASPTAPVPYVAAPVRCTDPKALNLNSLDACEYAPPAPLYKAFTVASAYCSVVGYPSISLNPTTSASAPVPGPKGFVETLYLADTANNYIGGVPVRWTSKTPDLASVVGDSVRVLAPGNAVIVGTVEYGGLVLSGSVFIRVVAHDCNGAGS
jgi:hypothetical protein